MKRSTILSAIFGSLMAGPFLATQVSAAPDMRVAYVDMQKAISASKAGQEAQKKYEVSLKKAQSGIDAKKVDFEKQRENFTKQKQSLNAKALSEKQEQLINLEKDLKRSFEDTQDELRRENARLVGDLVKRLRAVVDEVGRADGFTLILERSAQTVLYADSSIDITDKVVKKFDASAPAAQ